MKQVEKLHYDFSSYMAKWRWTSVWHQLDEVIQLDPESILEIGPGKGVFKHIASIFDLKVETLDIDSNLEPDHIGSATELPFPDKSFDVVCAFQMLEHLPYEQALEAFSEMARVAQRSIVISLPDVKPTARFLFHLPFFGSVDFSLPRPRFKTPVHCFDGEHYWELNKKDYGLKKVIRDFSSYAALVKSYRVVENPYHRFFVFDASG